MSNNKLKKNYDEFAIASIIESTKEHEKQIIGWRLVGDKKVTVDLSIRVIRKFRDEIIFKATTEEGHYQLQSMVNGADKLNFYFPQDMMLFQSEIKSFETKDNLVIKYPKMIAQVDRRKDLRLFIEEDHPVSVKFSKKNHGQISSSQVFDKRCFDLSAGGLSFVVSRGEFKFFQKDDIFDFTLLIESKENKVQGRVVNILEVEPDKRNKLNYKGWKICLNFEKLDEKLAKMINSYVFNFVEIDKEVL